MPALTIDDALTIGGWSASHARVLAMTSATTGGITVAAALVDTNGDGRHLDVGVYRRGTGAWHDLTEFTDVGKDGMGPGGSRIEMEPDDQTAQACVTAWVITWGRERAGSEVTVDLNAEWLTTTASQAGWWLALRPDS